MSAGFVHLLRAEWTKLRTVRGWVVALAVAVVLPAVFGLLGAGGSRGSCGDGCGIPKGPGGELVTDGFYFVHRGLSGDGEITVRVDSLTERALTGGPEGGAATKDVVVPWAKAGIMIKASTKEGSAYAAMMLTGGHGVRMQHDYVHDVAGPSASARWLRLSRSGDTITGFASADGRAWTKVGTATLKGLPSTVRAGLFTASPDHLETSQSLGISLNAGPAVATSTFSGLGLRGDWAQGAWGGEQIGGADNVPPEVRGGFRQSAGTFTLTGSGDMAPVVPPNGPGMTVTQILLVSFAGLIVIVVLGAMFMTAEYRRGLIRVTLTAVPHRGRALAAKAVVIGAAAFAAGAVGTVATIVPAREALRSRGVYVLPLSAWTELRVIAGTAALLALAAVLAMAIGTLLRRGAAAIATVIVTIVLPYFLAVTMLPEGAARWLLRVTPAAAFSVQQTLPEYGHVDNVYAPATGYFPLPPWAGFAVLCAWTALALGLAAVMLRRRDA